MILGCSGLMPRMAAVRENSAVVKVGEGSIPSHV